mgnify:FL=1
MATKKANKVSVQDRLDSIKSTVKDFNNEAINVSDQLVDVSIETGAKWQKLMGKVLDQGTVLMGKQQDLVLTTLEELKGQYSTGNKRFRKLVGWNNRRAQKAQRLAKKTAQKAEGTSITDLAKDDLKVINGIGPKMEKLLNEAGIFTYLQLSKAAIKDLTPILEAAGPRFKTQNPADWKKEAKKLA